MKKKLILTGVAIIMVLSTLASAACSTDKPGEVSWEVPIDNFMNKPDHSDEIEVPAGDTFILTLGSNPTTGYEWDENATISDTGVLKQEKHEFVEPDTDVVGAAGQEAWTFKALKKGTAKVSMEYSRPWEGGEKGEWTYDITVTVK
jgi:inhibitor of cysteine peptidase